MENLEGKTAVVTGAASGIGRAMAQAFGAKGMQIMLADVETGPLADAARELTADGFVVDTFEIDVRDVEQVRALEAASRERFGDIHVLCNNAGVGAGGPVAGDDDLDRWKWTIDVNLWGVIYGCKVFLPSMIEHGESGHIVNTASMAGHVAAPGMGPYNISKFGVVALSETMSRELQMEQSAIGVSVLCPAFVQTAIASSQRNLPAEVSAPIETEESAAVQSFVAALVAGGMAPTAVADAVVQAIAANSFWILTHPESKDAIAARAEQIVNGVNPAPFAGFE